IGRVIRQHGDADRELTNHGIHGKEHQMRPGPGNAQVFLADWKREDARPRDESPHRRWDRLRVGQGLPRMAIPRHPQGGLANRPPLPADPDYRQRGSWVPCQRLFGHPAAKAAATSGNSSSWWPVMAKPRDTGPLWPRPEAVGRLTTFCNGR